MTTDQDRQKIETNMSINSTWNLISAMASQEGSIISLTRVESLFHELQPIVLRCSNAARTGTAPIPTPKAGKELISCDGCEEDVQRSNAHHLTTNGRPQNFCTLCYDELFKKVQA